MRTRLGIGIGLAIATALAYKGLQNADFLNFDDPAYVSENPMVLGGLSWAGLKWAFGGAHAGNWHPLTWLSHMADVSLCGKTSACAHIGNVALHILNVLLLFRFLDRATGRIVPAAFVAGLFALHPLHVESVAWIAERKDVLCTFWWMVAINIYGGITGRASAVRLAALTGAAALALLSKPMAVTLPLALLLLDIWPLRRWTPWPTEGVSRPLLTRLRVIWPVTVLAAATAVVTFIVQREAGAVQSTDAFPLALRLMNVPVAYATYLWKTIWPHHLAPLYPYPESISWVVLACAMATLLTITAVATRARVQRPELIVGWLWFLLTLVPVIGLVQVGAQPFADRYTYIPLVGVFVMIVWPIADAVHGRVGARVATAAAVSLVAALGWLTSRQVAVWHDSVRLWTHTVSVTRDNYRAYTNLGHALTRAESAQRAEAALREALRLKPDYPNARNYLGALLVDRQRPAEAEVELRAALAVRPLFVEARNNLGLALAAQGRHDEATREFLTALDTAPAFAQARNNLGISLAHLRRFDEAIAAFETSLRQQPRSAEVHLNLATAYLDAGRPNDARPHLDAAIQYGEGPLRTEAERMKAGIRVP